MDLIAEQLKLEQESLALGQQRYLEEVDKAREDRTEANLGPVRGLIKRSLAAVTEAIEIKRQPKSGPGRAMTALKFLEGIESSALAFHALRGAMRGVSSQVALTKTALEVGTAVREEQRFRTMADADRSKYNMTQTRLKSATTGERKRRIMQHMSKAYIGEDMTPAEVLQVGVFLIDAVLESTNLFTLGMTSGSGSKQTVRVLRATEETLAWINDGHERMSLFSPLRMPMVVPPRPWTCPSDGGYLTDLCSGGQRDNIIKTHNKGYLQSLEDVDMPVVYSAINAIQSVPWQVNLRVLEVASACWDQGVSVGKSMPLRDSIPLPTPPCAPEDLPALRKNDPSAYKPWAAQAASIHEENAKAVSRRITCAERLNLATRFSQYPAIYFPHQMDFRGRMYPIPNHLHPQADDLSRGLLQFAEGKVPGERGLWWIKVHIANCHGVDKVSFEDRVRWTEARMSMWREIATDPMGVRDWMTADDPWQALAAILDLVRCTDDPEALSHLSIPMDGSCNGLQNFSALLRDPIGGAATNLVPSDKPADVYGEVAALVARKVDQDAAEGNEFAIVWQGRITRKLVKQPVMTLPYGATLSGMNSQIEAALDKLYPGLFPRNKAWPACSYLAKVTYAAIGEVVVAARSAMEWLQAVAKEAASADYPIRWTSPAGLPVLQDYREKLSNSVRLHIDGAKVDLELSREGDKLNRRRQSLAISPNLVHSFDAAHLQSTVVLCLEKGLTHFAFIHDSYGTLACDVDTMHWCLREAFIRQYTPNLLREFADEVQAQLGAEVLLPDLPDTGELDLGVIHQSRYFFA